MPWSAGYITNMFESEFSPHTAVEINPDLTEQRRAGPAAGKPSAGGSILPRASSYSRALGALNRESLPELVVQTDPDDMVKEPEIGYVASGGGGWHNSASRRSRAEVLIKIFAPR